jgi:glycosyltransferase involved in cell wall biosynthesis
MTSVAILLGTFNGARFLPDQLRSFENQTFANWRLFASDDGSTDATVAILSHFLEKLGPSKVQIRKGPGCGFVTNFLSLACDRTITSDYFAYSDQDDIWEPDKLSRATDWLQTIPPQTPAMFCSRTRLIDEEGRECGYSSLFRRKPSFRNALVQSIAGGNTVVFNEATRRLLMACTSSVQVPSHDWWTYLLTTAAGGVVCYDPVPLVRYRVHPANVVGSNVGWLNHIRRVQMLARDRLTNWTTQNVAALESFRLRMTPENRELFDLFCQARNQSLLQRQVGFYRAGVYRQTILGNLGLIFAVWAKKI